MNRRLLAAAVIEQARQLNERSYSPGGARDEGARDTAELVQVLARIVNGSTVERAFGAPGDWGYGTAIGDALAAREQAGPATESPQAALMEELKQVEHAATNANSLAQRMGQKYVDVVFPVYKAVEVAEDELERIMLKGGGR